MKSNASTPTRMDLLRHCLRAGLCLIILSSIMSAQDHDLPERRAVSSEGSGMSLETVYDVLHYRLETHLAMTDSMFSGVMRMRLRMTGDSPRSIHIHALGLQIHSVGINDTLVTFSLNPSEETLQLQLPRMYASGETLSAVIDYQRDTAFQRIENRQGYYWYPQGYQPSVLANIGYTMSEPYDARLWMPCFDDPSDKATCEMIVSVPDGNIVASNGVLDSVITAGGTSTFHWSEDHPVATYLMFITASAYTTFSHTYTRLTQPEDTVEVRYYIWRADSAGTTYNAVQAFSNVVPMMQTYASLFLEYPFDVYGMAIVYPFQFGGMEHQSIASIHKSWISTAGYPYYEDYIAHELAHQWWGDLVTCASFKDIWLNEGFASYAEALWREKTYGVSEYDRKMRSFMTFSRTWNYAIYDPVGQGQPIFGSSVYHKGAWILHMLRSITGDSAFMEILHTYRNAHSYGTATTEDFIAAVNAVTGTDHRWFFDQWIYGPGWPTYAYTVIWNDTTGEEEFHLAQRQTDYPLFTMPIELTVWRNGVDTTHVLWDSLAHQIFPIGADFDSIAFDPRNRVLKKVEPWSTSAGGGPEMPLPFELRQNYPNPFNPTTRVQFTISRMQFVTLRIYDVLGREVARLVDGVLEPGVHRIEFSPTNLAGGVYFYRLSTESASALGTMVYIR